MPRSIILSGVSILNVFHCFIACDIHIYTCDIRLNILDMPSRTAHQHERGSEHVVVRKTPPSPMEKHYFEAKLHRTSENCISAKKRTAAREKQGCLRMSAAPRKILQLRAT